MLLSIGAVSSGLVFREENTNQDMESCNKEELMEVIRREHLSVRNCHLDIGHGQPLLPIAAHNDGRPLDCEREQRRTAIKPANEFSHCLIKFYDFVNLC